MSELHAKLRANHHRRKREQFVRDANPALARVLESSDVVTGLDVQTWISSIPWPTFDDGRLTTTKGDLAGSTFSDWDDRIHVADALAAIPLPPATDAHLYLDNDGPLFRIPLNSYHDLLPDILAFSQLHHDSDFAWVSLDLKHGILLSNYCGYLPENRRTTLHEIVYEIQHWGI